MKPILFFIILILNSDVLFAQQVPCDFDSYVIKNKHSIEIANNKIAQKLNNSFLRKSATTNNIYVIPVVVHVIHNGGTENISDAQIQSQIDILNEDYRKIVGTLGDGNGVDSEIEFCLAKKDPQGRCTNGIVRIKSTLTNHQSYQRADLANLSSWDATRYLNIYVVKTMAGGVLGYASFPGGPTNQDGCVMVHNYFGRVGTASSSLGRTASHEIGHWFGLYHTFNNSCGVDTCTDGDLVCDTPPVVNPNFGCPIINSCHNELPDVNDQIQNYMDYTDDACKSMFTYGQKMRMHTTLDTIRTIIWSQSNLIATGCDSGFVSPPCNVVADFTSNGDTICLGSSVLFTNKSLNTPTAYQWYFNGGSPSTAITANATILYNSLGTYDVKLIVSGALGNDSIISLNHITVINPANGQTLPYSEGFESTVFPPNGISIDNPDTTITWQRDTIALAYSGNGTAKINNLININYGQADAMILPPFDFTTSAGVPYLTFKWAYARSDANYSDDLIVLVSKDCGVNWIQVFTKSGAALATGTTQTTPYIPDSNTVWKSASINLNTYSTYSRVLIKIVNVTDGGNNLYIDNINIGVGVTGINETRNSINYLLIYPNPSSGNLYVEYEMLREDNISTEIIDVLGRTVFKINNKAQTIGKHKQEINAVLEDGIYTLILKTGNVVSSKRVIINK